ncbi:MULTISPECIES: hypothetical protein [unclassified Pseudomonas]|uniref:hypothetical protein n=1 Tax=unclassified Pseudomonas TaxID=196821 RepID=UPI000A1F1F2D|nr:MULTISPECIES: hypothetical protein [unclassified Pseudomonas]
MSFQEILTFLLPSADPLQLLFAGLIGLLSLLTVVALKRGAREQTWASRWKGGGQDELDVEHGSLHEISAAVASPGERMVEYMPGILLILGLLGTFLGLGIALNKASTILVDANAGGGMDDAMKNLMGMMEGLGTKFKTSTWGILAFLLLKLYAARNGYEERRLRWCAKQMKHVFDSSRQQRQEERQQAQMTLLDTLARLDQNMAAQNESQRQLLDLQSRQFKHHTATTQQALTKNRSSIDALLEPLKVSLQDQQAGNQTLQTLLQEQQTGNQTLQALLQEQQAGTQSLLKGQQAGSQQLQKLQELQATANQAGQALLQEAQAGSKVRQDLLQAQQASGKTLATALPILQALNGNSEQVLTALGGIDTRLQQHGEQNQAQLEDARATRQAGQALLLEAQAGSKVRKDLLQAQQATGKTLATVLPMLQALNGTSEQVLTALGGIDTQLEQHGEQNQAQLEDARATRQAMEHLIDSNARNLAAISGAAEQMASAASTIGESAGDLQQAIADFKEGVAGVLGHLKQDLGETIGLMGSSFTGNMEQMSASLSDATQGISIAVNNLSQSVGEIMDDMKSSNERSLKMQATALSTFESSSYTLQEKVQGMTHLVEVLQERITSGLKAVSESGRRMVSLDGRYDEVTKQAELAANEIKALVGQLSAMQQSSPLQPAVDALAARVEMIGRNLQGIQQHLEALGNLAERNQQHSTGTEITQSLRQIIEQLHVLDRPQPVVLQQKTVD